jgi:hypothetical protein
MHPIPTALTSSPLEPSSLFSIGREHSLAASRGLAYAVLHVGERRTEALSNAITSAQRVRAGVA